MSGFRGKADVAPGPGRAEAAQDEREEASSAQVVATQVTRRCLGSCRAAAWDPAL